ncbi:protein tyrosine phosphatase [Desulfatibacillum alkenivorans DSM 16219]|jgi:arsenate reductase|uniref:Protein tyrosine phosphatase n=1 Tax=Desulfatibacillum alkenivorans DSM 16219 TaxID=1121393 RepID=A0A1M6EFW7_9BACT|nr:arsenate reductase ArsC [Desulfatibacillum alkenivorans]SHI84188.1 protein tyrosine phosphatase [Desulfatibacillum alkenivorans DSM 16219]
MSEELIKILFLCTGNSCRSQMAEGFVNHLRSDEFRAWSAGVETHGLNPLAVKVMAEVGIDISSHTSKLADQFLDKDLDYVVTVCDHAKESCPMFLGRAKKVHAGFEDPPALAADAKTEEDALVYYRKVRDEIRAFVEAMPDNLNND